jgi:hypothetical protein
MTSSHRPSPRDYNSPFEHRVSASEIRAKDRAKVFSCVSQVFNDVLVLFRSRHPALQCYEKVNNYLASYLIEY